MSVSTNIIKRAKVIRLITLLLSLFSSLEAYAAQGPQNQNRNRQPHAVPVGRLDADRVRWGLVDIGARWHLYFIASDEIQDALDQFEKSDRKSAVLIDRFRLRKQPTGIEWAYCPKKSFHFPFRGGLFSYSSLHDTFKPIIKVKRAQVDKIGRENPNNVLLLLRSNTPQIITEDVNG